MKIFKLLKKELHNKDHLLLHLKIVLDLNKGSDVVISIHNTTNKVLSSSPNYVVDVRCGHVTKFWLI